jgi:riboflavin synthase
VFKGIIQYIGSVLDICLFGADFGFKVSWNKNIFDLQSGSSVACNGICLTVQDLGKDWFLVYASPETCHLTNLARLKVGDFVNLEPALKVSDTIDGHFVQGHVDCVAKITQIQQDGKSHVFAFELPDDIAKYVVQKGSITIDGVSLTVNKVSDKSFWVNIIPYTFANTIFCKKKVGDFVNLEVDLFARYTEKLLKPLS